MKDIPVTWFTCDCPWTTKYCDEFHTAYAIVPEEVLLPWVVNHDTA